MFIKPGPFIFAEYQGFGIPLWLQERHPECLMVVHRPQAFPQPALNHPGYLALVRAWFEQVAVILRPYVGRGVVVALQIDNETGYPQFGQGPHLTDRNPETLSLLRLVLKEHFGTVQALNAAWGTSFVSFDAVEPPEERQFNAAQMDTMARWVEDYIVRYLTALRDMWLELDLGIFLFLNDIWLDSWPSHLGKKNRVAPLAFDIYPRYSDLPVTFDQPFSISYVPRLFGSCLQDGPLMSAELGAGWLDPGCQVRNEATFLSAMAAYAHGTQAIFFYILADGRDPDGDYVFDSFVGLDGEPTGRLAVLNRLADFKRHCGAVLAETQEVASPIAILHNPAVTREMMSAALDPVGAFLKGSQRPIDEVMTIVSVNAGLFGALAESGHQPTVCNLEQVSLETLRRFQVVFFNAIGVLDARNRQKLEQFVREGGTLVTLGTPFEENTYLFPATVQAVSNPQSWWVMGRIAWDYVRFYLRVARSFRHRLCAYTVEGMYPAMLLNKHATRAGLWLRSGLDGARIWASRLVTLSTPRGEVEPLLWQGKRLAGYVARLGGGRSVFLGTLLGAAFDSPGYYLDEPANKASIKAFLQQLLHGWGVTPFVTPASDLELVVREGPDWRMAFVLNRGPQRAFDLQLRMDWRGWRFQSAWGTESARLEWTGERLIGIVATEDVLVGIWKRSDAA